MSVSLAAAPAALSLCAPALPSGNDAEEALEAAERALEDDPADPALLDRAARCAKEAGDADRALWYAKLGLEAAGDAKDQQAVAKSLAAFAAAIEPPAAGADALLTSHAEGLFRLAQVCQRAKLYANAVDLLARCLGTSFEAKAQARLEKIFEDEKIVDALLAADIDVPARPATKKTPEWLAKEDAKHQDWEKAYEIESKFYTVQTNMGYELAHSISTAMQQMNAFYRRVFQYKERGGSMRSCGIKIYKSRTEFDQHEDAADKPTMRGFFAPLENRVATYDPRTDGFELRDLWSTLFHEASHQFSEAFTTNLTPAWLNEGTASYFEGAFLLPSGQVRTNRIPERRLSGLLGSFDEGSPKVKDVISFFQDGSYQGSYYPFGWGLVYFIQNYEDEASERVYLPVYQEYWSSYKSAENHDPFARFVEYFVEKADQKGIETFEDFEERWIAWIRELGDLYFGPPERADALVERARKQVKNGKPAYAMESYRWALEKRYDDHVAALELATVLEGLGDKDGALYGYRRVLAAARSQQDPAQPFAGFGERSAADVAQDCLKRIEKIDRNVAQAAVESDAALVAGAKSAATSYVDASLPRNALHLLGEARAFLGGSGELAALEEEIRSKSGVDLLRWRRLPLGDGLPLWEAGADWSGSGEEVRVATEGLVFATCREELLDTYRYEVTVHPTDLGDNPVYGLVFGSSVSSGARMFAIIPKAGIAGLVRFAEGQPEIAKSFPCRIAEGADAVRLAIEVGEGAVELFADGKRLGRVELPPRELRGQVGLMAQDVSATFGELRVRY